MKMKCKEIVRVVIMLMLLVMSGRFNSYDIYVFAENSAPKNIQKMNEEEAKAYVADSALEWAKLMQPDKNLKVKTIRKIKTMEKEAEFMVAFQCGKENYGYAILKNESFDFVVNEGGIQEGHKDLYENIVENMEKNCKSSIKVGKHLIKFSDRQYGVEYECNNKKAFYDNSGRTIKLEDKVYTESYKTEQTIFISKKNWTVNNYKVLESIQLKDMQKDQNCLLVLK